MLDGGCGDVVSLENFPAGHEKHSEFPVTLLYFPAMHGMHAELFLAPTLSEYVPIGQSEQNILVLDDSLLSMVYLPTGHWMHVELPSKFV